MSQQPGPPLVIPFRRLSTEALRGLIEEFVTREGTDYGQEEVGLEQKVQQVLAELTAGRAVVVFDPIHQTCHIAPAEVSGSRRTEETADEDRATSPDLGNGTRPGGRVQAAPRRSREP